MFHSLTIRSLIFLEDELAGCLARWHFQEEPSAREPAVYFPRAGALGLALVCCRLVRVCVEFVSYCLQHLVFQIFLLFSHAIWCCNAPAHVPNWACPNPTYFDNIILVANGANFSSVSTRS